MELSADELTEARRVIARALDEDLRYGRSDRCVRHAFGVVRDAGTELRGAVHDGALYPNQLRNPYSNSHRAAERLIERRRAVEERATASAQCGFVGGSTCEIERTDPAEAARDLHSRDVVRLG